MVITTNMTGVTPSAEMLDQGGNTSEIGYNTADSVLFVEDSGSVHAIDVSAGAFRTEADMIRDQDINKQTHPASGFLNWGNARKSDSGGFKPVNEGMYTALLKPNAIYVGNGNSASAGLDTSPTGYPRTLVAGIIHDIYGICQNGGEYELNEIYLPPAPDGTVTFDSATGVITQHDSAAEAFGIIEPSDILPNGTAATWDSNTRTATRGTAGTFGAYVKDVPIDRNYFEAILTSSHDEDLEIKDGPGGSNKTIHSFSLKANTPTKISFKGNRTNKEIYIRVQYAESGQTLKINSWNMRADKEVVTRRVDMFGCEYFLREVTKSDAWIYPKGAIQSALSTMNGIKTATNTQRPQTYFAHYDGHNPSHGKGLNLFNLSAKDLRKVAQDPANKIYKLNDGRIVQWCYRVRSFAGAGNGDWYSIDPETNNKILWLRWGEGANTKGKTVMSQGNRDITKNFIDSGSDPAYFNSFRLGNGETGIFTAALFGAETPDTRLAVDGLCYFQVWGTCSRLNTGAYHPSSNPEGTTYFAGEANGTGTTYTWHHSTSESKGSTQYNCFLWAHNSHGNISGISARPDGRYYDAIYSSGLGGIDDHRMSCRDTGSPEYAAAKMQKVISGEYRGAEKLKYTKGGMQTADTHESTAGYLCAKSNCPPIGAVVYLQNTDGTYRAAIVDQVTSDGFHTSTSGNRVKNSAFLYTTDSDITVSGEYTMQNVIGDPANILKVFPNGFYGEWLPTMPNGNSQNYQYTRPLQSKVSVLKSYDIGKTWLTDTWGGFDSATNSRTVGLESNWISINFYTVKARQTKPTTNKAILHGKAGIGDVFYSSSIENTAGRLLNHSLSDEITKNIYGFRVGNANVSGYSLIGGKLSKGSPNQITQHDQLALSTPSNDSATVKALWSQFAESKQANIQLNYQALKYSIPMYTTAYQENTNWSAGTYYKVQSGAYRGLYLCVATTNKALTWENWVQDTKGNIINVADNTVFFINMGFNRKGNWGDDSKIHIVDNDSTKQDLNGVAVKVGTHRLVKPLGYTW